MADGPSESVFLIDAMALIFQNFHAVGPMSAPDGRPTNALFGFTRDLLQILTTYQPTYLLCAFDLPGPTFRHSIDPGYKAQRPDPPGDLTLQIPLIQQVIEAMNVPILAVESFEADDVMATVAHAAAQRGYSVYLCTSDKDCRQLINDRIQLINIRKGVILDRAGLLAEWGITPEQVVDFQALVGDSVDNIKGVPGIGEKTAAKLLQQFGTLDELVKQLDQVRGPKMQENLRLAIQAGYLERARQMVRLKTDVPVHFDWDAWRRREWNAEKLLALFHEFGFRRFAEQVRATLKSQGARQNAAMLEIAGLLPPSGPSANNGSPHPPRLFDDLPVPSTADLSSSDDFPFGANVVADAWKTDYRLIDTPEAFQSFLDQLRQQPVFCFDLETTGLNPTTAQIVGLAFCWRAETAYYLPLRGPEGSTVLPSDATLAALRPVFENPRIGKKNQNIKFDKLVLHFHGIPLAGVIGDSMVAHYLLHATARSHNLDELTREYLRHENIPLSELIGKGKQQKTLDQVEVVRVKDYACEDADAAWRLCEKLEPQLAEQGLRSLYDTVEIPLIDILARMEATGVRLDVAFLKSLSQAMTQQLAELESAIYALAGHEFNIASLKQLRTVLFDELQLPVQKRTGITHEPSTDQETLEILAALGHELPKKIVAHRQISKLKSTYVEALPSLVQPKTGRVHTSFNQTVTVTGRLSSSDPNLQNIPARTEQGREIRKAFVPEPGWLLLSADYSQIELRLLAHFCQDPALCRAFAEDRDIHTAVAAEIFKVAEAAVTSEMRRVAKTVNFGVIYGISAHGLATRLGMPRGEAERFIDAYFARYPQVLHYQDDLLRKARQVGYVSTLLGRRRRFDASAIRAHSTYQQRNSAEREAINMEIQGSAADLIKLAMLAIDRRLRNEGLQARMLLTVHDELVLELPPNEVATVAGWLRQEMSNALELRVPLKVDVSVGPNWLETEEVR